MTAIFLVWNKTGLALAADKSLTATERDEDGNERVLFNDFESKIFKGKNRNFAIGMAGNAEINGIPVQGILHKWEKNCETKNYLTDYVEDFLKWLASYSLLEFAASNNSTTTNYVSGSLKHIQVRIDSKADSTEDNLNIVKEVFADWQANNPPNIFGFSPLKFTTDYETNESIDSDQHLSIEFCKRFADFRLDDEFYGNYIASLSEIVIGEFKEIFTSEFDETIAWHREIRDGMVKFLIDHTNGNFRTADLIFVGYGESDWYPQAVKISLYNFDQMLPWAVVNKVTNPIAVWYQSLGQNQTFENFLDPINVTVKNEIYEALQSNYGKKPYLEKIVADIDRVIDSHGNDLLGPIRNKIKLLSIDKLAFLAQQMVSLESFHSFIREYLPTVGGEIDVVKLTRVDNEYS